MSSFSLRMMKLNKGGILRKNHQYNSTFSSKITHFKHKKHIYYLPPEESKLLLKQKEH